MTSPLPPDGVSVALLTPVTDPGEIDGPALEKLVARAADSGAAGFSPVGSTGEGSRLSRAQRREVVTRVVEAAQGRPVIAGVPAQPADDLLADLEVMAEVGADAALVTPPGTYALSDDELVELFDGLAARSPLPLVLYHIPRLAGVGFLPEVVGRLARHPRVVGLKDSSRDLEYLHAVVRATRNADFRVVTGTDTLLPESLAAGAVGAIVASPNVVPDLGPRLYDAALAGDLAEVAAVRAQIVDVVSVCRKEGFPAGWKAAAALVGACGPRPVPPGHPLGADGVERLTRAFERLGIR